MKKYHCLSIPFSFENRVEAEIDITGDIEDIDVPPLLFLSFVENCFKHGMKGTDKLEIKINFKVLPTHYLEFTISNSFNPEIYLETKNGIGNENAKRRLNLLFSNNYVLETQIEANTYNLFLKTPVK